MKQYRIHIALVVIVIILAAISFRQGGLGLVRQGLWRGISILFHEMPLLAAAFLTAGFLQALIREEAVSKWLGQEAGLRGILLSCLAGGLIPGGPYAYYPIAQALLKSGAGLGVLVAFVTAKNVWSVSRLPLEVAILGTRITFIRYLVTFLIPPLIGITAEHIFGPQIDRIREEMGS